MSQWDIEERLQIVFVPARGDGRDNLIEMQVDKAIGRPVAIDVRPDLYFIEQDAAERHNLSRFVETATESHRRV
jgi:hypothetical protein